jgi:predicted Zn finger-like uncharacterized protein
MILTCTSCASRYFADSEAIGAGRMVRCAACGHEWFAEPSLLLETQADQEKSAAKRPKPPPEPAPEAVRPTTAAMIRARHAARVRRRQRLHALLAAGAALLLLVGTAGAGAAWRDPLAQVWPKSATVFERLGLEVNATNLAIEGLEVQPAPGPTPDVALVRGVIRNQGRRQAQARPVRLMLLAADGRHVASTIAQPSSTVLKALSVTRFEARFEKPSPEARFLAAQFAAEAPGPSEPPAKAPPGRPASTTAAKGSAAQ